MNTMCSKSEIKNYILHLDEWFKKWDFKYYTVNYTPTFAIIDKLSTNNNFIGVLWRQIFRISPFDFRMKLGLLPNIVDPQATIILAFAYLELYIKNKDDIYRECFDICIKRIISLKSSKTKYFAVKQSKKIYLKYYKTTDDDISPLLTVWAGELFLHAYEYFDDEYFRLLAEDIKDYFLYDHPREDLPEGVYFFYSPTGNFKIWNASCEISSFLIKYGKTMYDQLSYELGGRGMNLIISNQNFDGSWYYGGTPSTHYIDNFHTAFILRSINNIKAIYNTDVLEKVFEKGMTFYKDNLFKKIDDMMVRPRHYCGKNLPLNSNVIQKTDIRDCALSIILFTEVYKKESIEQSDAFKVFNWTINNMTNGTLFYAEKTWFWTNKIVYIDFQAWVFLSLIKLI